MVSAALLSPELKAITPISGREHPQPLERADTKAGRAGAAPDLFTAHNATADTAEYSMAVEWRVLQRQLRDARDRFRHSFVMKDTEDVKAAYAAAVLEQRRLPGKGAQEQENEGGWGGAGGGAAAAAAEAGNGGAA